MLTLMGFGQTSLSGVRRGFMPPQLKADITTLDTIIIFYGKFRNERKKGKQI